MANPSSSHNDRDRDRERERVIRERSHHHHRTISSTTLLLILSLVLAVLAVMLSLPSTRSGTSSLSNPLSSKRGNEDPILDGSGLWGSFFNPRRSEALVAREHQVAKRESEVAMREADILANALATCNPIATVTEIVENIPPVQTIFKEIIHYSTENAIAPAITPAPIPDNSSEFNRRIEDLIQRETKIADREKEMGRREELVNRRENDATRRESWILDQLIALGGDPQVIEEEYIIDQPAGKRKVKAYLSSYEPSVVISDKHSQPTPPPANVSPAPAPANTRPAAFPLPVSFSTKSQPPSIPTFVSEVAFENAAETDEYEDEPVVYRRVRPRNPW